MCAIHGKKEWQPVLNYVERLHEKSCFPPEGPLPYPWENTGPGYCYGPAFGHWDAVHIALDRTESGLLQAKYQIDNLIAVQEQNGMFPSMIWMRKNAPSDWAPDQTHPPVWVAAADLIYRETGDRKWLTKCRDALARQVHWFEAERSVNGGGFFYTDIRDHLWESGVDEGIRFLDVPEGEKACVDASSHVYLMLDRLQAWQQETGGAGVTEAQAKKEKLGQFIRERLYDAKTEYYYDSWSAENPAYRHLCLEGLWPVIVGAADPAQAQRVIQRHLMNAKEFLTPHPVPTVAWSDPLYEKRMWRGPAWNSMTMWAAVGCMRYGMHREAKCLLEAALDRTAEVYAETGCIWEFYDSLGGSPERVQRKPQTEFNKPCRDYLGHNPLLFMARLWEMENERG